MRRSGPPVSGRGRTITYKGRDGIERKVAVGGQDVNQYKPYTTISHSTTVDAGGGSRKDVLKVISVPEANEMDSGQLPSVKGKVV